MSIAMRVARKQDENRILDFLKKDIGNCVYIYMDLKKYGLESEEIKIWINEGNTLDSVVMKYHECIHIYSDGNNHLDEIFNLIYEISPVSIRGSKENVEQLFFCETIKNSYSCKSGSVFRFTNYRVLDDDRICRASVDDCEDIAQLMFIDEDFRANYTLADLALQLKERILDGTGRNLIIRDNERLIAHIATFAEDDEIAITSGLIVHPEYRNYLYGVILESRLVNELLEEKKKVFTFVNEKVRFKFLRSMRAQECGSYMKLMKT